MNDHDDETRVRADAPTALAETPDRSRLALLGALSAGAAGGGCGTVDGGGQVIASHAEARARQRAAEAAARARAEEDPRLRQQDTSGGDGGGGGGAH